MRAIKLWVYAIFSPLFTLNIVSSGFLSQVDSKKTFSIKEFIGLAFVPAVVSLVLGFGLIVIGAVQQGGMSKSTCTGSIIVNSEQELKNPNSGQCKITTIMGSPENTISVKALKNPDTEDFTSYTVFTF